ncbi:polypeptide N-acetylgalactosaminyltransferase 5 [Biomphalaria pfeifferi]|uniref:Polypeptide N-acetylgalactosaminyltransferase n=1 Tax=Biomphalaria pfeifferi TaxID=112525 RepID=A0AAD8CDF4_BIOPF|nr:polypeptide N-acetylgalactosaminyltransferase 5 [Biomphalaria pfeifferi]
MKAHRKVFRFLVLVVVVWLLVISVIIYSTLFASDTQPAAENKRDQDIYRLSVNQELLQHVANHLMHNISMQQFLASKLNLTKMETTKTAMLPNAQNTYQFYQQFWPAKADPASPGFGGRGVTINKTNLSDRDKIIFDTGYNVYKVNLLASEVIPLRRDIHIDMPECQTVQYNVSSLARVGIVLIFHNELWSVMLRTVYSLLDASPEELINEIILVDDASDKEFLWKPLDEYIKIFGGKVKLIRLPTRSGLIRARNVGFDHVTGSVAVFLDAHVEVHKGWLEPLLQRIKEDDKVVAVPQHDQINWDTFKFEFKPNADHQLGGFDFDLTFNWIGPPPLPDGVVRKTLADPVRTPTHLGCCFAITKDNFNRLGRYDPDLDIWGCENLELSFKSWMCGGSLEAIPCSHVGHLYRPAFPYSWGTQKDTLIRNCLRVAEVWLDEYKEVYYDRISNLQTGVDIGDISARKSLRAKLQCKSFDWYVKHIYPDLYIPVNTTATGKISSQMDQTLCISMDVHWQSINKIPSIVKCNSRDPKQHFFLSKERQIRRDDGCLLYDQASNKVVMGWCRHSNSQWGYTQANTLMALGTNQCMTMSTNTWTVGMSTCNDHDGHLKWLWPRKSVIL